MGMGQEEDYPVGIVSVKDKTLGKETILLGKIQFGKLGNLFMEVIRTIQSLIPGVLARFVCNKILTNLFVYRPLEISPREILGGQVYERSCPISVTM